MYEKPTFQKFLGNLWNKKVWDKTSEMLKYFWEGFFGTFFKGFSVNDDDLVDIFG